ncbi:MAG TPA: hypothetical protein GXZ35_04205 [Acholeplasmataceae bacterium]|jgi:hypothetical protein|nr:hypothetical protein [Acholeplasmataceae bacterium]
MKFIHCFSEELKNKLLQNGYNLLVETNGIFIFENSPTLFFDFGKIDSTKFTFSNKMIF